MTAANDHLRHPRQRAARPVSARVRARIAVAAAALCGAALVTGGGHAQPAPAAPPDGARLFANQCAACHSTVAGETRVGPSLHGVAGRRVGALGDYPYSDALRAKGAGGLAWTAENLDAWLADTAAFVPGSVMNFHQADPAKRAAIIGYLSGLK